MDFVEVTEAVVLGAAFDVEGDYRVAVAMDALHLAVGLLGVDVAVGDALLQEFFRQGDALQLVEAEEVAVAACASLEAGFLGGEGADLPWLAACQHP